MVYVDPLAVGIATDKQAARVGARNSHRWCHMIADGAAELMDFGERIGLSPGWLQHAGTEREHFDLTPRRRQLAVRLGAKEIGRRDLVNIIRAKREARKRTAASEGEGEGGA